jgi:hypothetical protein
MTFAVAILVMGCADNGSRNTARRDPVAHADADATGTQDGTPPTEASADAGVGLDGSNYDGRVVAVDASTGCPEILIYQPVCGVDGRTYGNRGAADCACAAILHDGACDEAAPGQGPPGVNGFTCYEDRDCATGSECVGALCTSSGGLNGVCEDRVTDPRLCWMDSECGTPALCMGVSICPAGAACDGPDRPGLCVDP